MTDPDDGHDVRTGDILPDGAVDRSSNAATRGNVYVVWLDRRFDMRTAPDAGGYFVGAYAGLDHVGTAFHPTWVGANSGNLANRTDVFHRAAG